MWYVIIACAAALTALILINRSTVKKLQASVKEKESLRNELLATKTQLAKKDQDAQKLQEVISELQKIKTEQAAKTSTRKKKDPAPAGDSASRLERLNN